MSAVPATVPPMRRRPVDSHREEYKNFLEHRIAELRLESKRLRRVASGLGEQKANCERGALQAVEDAHRLDREADAIGYALKLILKAQDARKGHPDVIEAVELIREDTNWAARIVLNELRSLAVGGLAEATWDEICAQTNLGVHDVREGLTRLEAVGAIELRRDGRGIRPFKYAVR